MIPTESAIKRIQSIIEDNKFFRITITSGGCSGFNYNFAFDTRYSDDDLVLWEEKFHSYQIITDTCSADFLQGSSLDYLDQLDGSYFTLKIEGTTSQCGCGHSFSL